jgi:cytochrome P450
VNNEYDLKKGAWLTNLIGAIRSLVGRQSLPPGDQIELDSVERTDRRILLALAAEHGPIFKLIEQNHSQICVIGLPLARRLLKVNALALRPVTIELTSLFSEGFMRQMVGETHTKYRTSLVAAIYQLELPAFLPELRIIASSRLGKYFVEAGTREDTSQDYLDALTDIATGLLLRVFFGASPGTEAHTNLLTLFKNLGPHGLVWNITDVQTLAFKELCAELKKLLSEKVETGMTGGDGILQILHGAGSLDDTLLGNLIYMVEMGRYDMRGLFRWISRNAANAPEWVEEIRAPVNSDIGKAWSVARAFIQETLRMDQSERLIREVTDDFIFENFQFPKGWRVRICLWESHKNAENFPQPFEFEPERFLSNPPSRNSYSPFGLDRHQCPFSEIAVTLGTVFLQCLAQEYRVSALNDGSGIRGAYHWEPPTDFTILLSRISS